MIGVLRMWGVPARYVSGYLLTRAPQDGAAMLGADASHAWVQVLCPRRAAAFDSAEAMPLAAQEAWLDLDPTNDLIPACPNYHAMLHRGVPVPRTIAELQRLMGRAIVRRTRDVSGPIG